MIDDEHPIEFNIAYHPTPYPRAMREDLKEIGEVCDGIYLPVSESDLAYAANKIKSCIDIAHELNLVVTADFWGFGNLFACGAIPSLFTLQHPEHNCIDSHGRSIPKSCPNNPAVRAFFQSAIEAFVGTYEPDGLFWDEPQWALGGYLGVLDAGAWVCRCACCQEAFRTRFGHDMPAMATPEVETFRSESMLHFLAGLCRSVKAIDENLITSACVMPGDPLAFKEAVGKMEDLDILGVDPYWRPADALSQREYIELHTGEIVRIARENGKLVESWVCAWQQTLGHEADPYRAAKQMASLDIDYLSAWSYLDYVSWAPCDMANAADPERVWRLLRRAYHEIRAGDMEIHI